MTRLFASIFLFLFISACSGSQPAYETGNYDETQFGDLSGDRFAPTVLVLGANTTQLTAAVISGDRDYLTLRVPAGTTLSSLVLTDYQSTDPRAFIAVQRGQSFSEPAEDADPAALLGYSLFGDEQLNINLLTAMAEAEGVAGFTPPLTAGDYSFWVQQTSKLPTEYGFRFTLTAE